MAGGQAGFAGHLRIGSGARIAAKSGVMRDVEPGATVGGIPAVPLTAWMRQIAILQRLARKKDAVMIELGFRRQSELMEIDRERIMEMIPHRHPFLMIDKVVDVVANERATGIKNGFADEYYFRGHFPSAPGDAWRADHRSDGADRGGARRSYARPGVGTQAGLFHEHRQRPVPPAGVSGG